MNLTFRPWFMTEGGMINWATLSGNESDLRPWLMTDALAGGLINWAT